MRIITDNRLLILLARIPKRFRWMSTIGVTVTLVVLWSFFFLIPLFFEIKKYKKQMQVQEKICTMFAKKVSREKNRDLSGPPDLVLVELARKNKLSCTHLVSNQAGEHDIGLQGSFRNVLRFLDKFSCVTYRVKIKKFFCCRAKKRQVQARLCVKCCS